MDNMTRYTVTYLLRTKDEALEAYKLFEVWAITQQHCRAIKVIRSDRGGEYLSGAFDEHLAKPSMGNVTVEHNVYFRTSAQLKGEEEKLPASDSKRAAAPHIPPNDPPNSPTVKDADEDNEMEQQEEQPEKLLPPPLCCSEHLQRPSCMIQDLQSGEGITLARRGSPKVSMGLQMSRVDVSMTYFLFFCLLTF